MSSRLDRIKFDAYDADNRLLQVSAITEQGQATTRFHYDALGTRIAKQVIPTNNSRPENIEETRFIWQGMRMAQEIQADQLSTYVYDPDAEYSPLVRFYDPDIGRFISQDPIGLAGGMNLV